MKVVLEYSLPEDAESYEEAYHGGKYKYILQDLDNHMRNILKYQEVSDDVEDCVTLMRELLHNKCMEYEVGIW